MACRLTYCCIEDTSLCEDDQSDENGQSDEDINSSSSQSPTLHLTETSSRWELINVIKIDNPVDDDIKQYARVQIHNLTKTRARETVTKWLPLEYCGKRYFLKMKIRGQEKDLSSSKFVPRCHNCLHPELEQLAGDCPCIYYWLWLDERKIMQRFMRDADAYWRSLARSSELRKVLLGK